MHSKSTCAITAREGTIQTKSIDFDKYLTSESL